MAFTEDEKAETLARLTATESEIKELTKMQSKIFGAAAVMSIVASLIGAYLIFQLHEVSAASVNVAVLSSEMKHLTDSVSSLNSAVDKVQSLITTSQSNIMSNTSSVVDLKRVDDELSRRLDRIEDKRPTR